MDPPKINYVNNNSIMVVNKHGLLRQLFTPFHAQVILETEDFNENSWVVVEEVKPHPQFILLYRVINYWYPYFVFKLDVRF